MYKIVGFSKNLKKFTAGRTSESDNRGELFSLVQPVAFQKANNTVLKNRVFRLLNLHPKANPPLGTTSPDNSRPTGGFHANPKAMSPLSSSHGWLISAFHLFPLRPINKTPHYNP
jgi:hypothetical protein